MGWDSGSWGLGERVFGGLETLFLQKRSRGQASGSGCRAESLDVRVSVCLPACMSARICVEMCAGCSPSPGLSIPSHSLPLFRAPAALISSGPFPASSPHFPLLGLALPGSLVSSPSHPSGLRPLAGEPSASVPGPSFCSAPALPPSLLPALPAGWFLMLSLSSSHALSSLPQVPAQALCGLLSPLQGSVRHPSTPSHVPPSLFIIALPPPRPPLSSSWALISAQIFFLCPVCPPLLFMTTCFPFSCVLESGFPSPARGSLVSEPSHSLGHSHLLPAQSPLPGAQGRMESTRLAVRLRGTVWAQGWASGLLRDALGRGTLLITLRRWGGGRSLGMRGQGGAAAGSGVRRRWLAGEELERERPSLALAKWRDSRR